MDVDHILNGCRLKNEKHLEDIRFSFISRICNSESDVCKQVTVCNSELERVKLLKEYFHWKSIEEEPIPYTTKSYEIASELMKKAASAVKRKNFDEALRGLNLSVMFANDQILGTVFAKRAELFIEMHEEEAALKDIQLALDNKCPKQLMKKLLSERESWKKERVHREHDHKDIHQEIVDNQAEFLNLKTPHKNIPRAEEFLSIDYAETCGRRIVTTKNVDAGTLLISEKTYSSILSNLFGWDTEHCHFCCKPMLGGIPSPDCVFVIYCSEKCRRTASQHFHHYEKELLPFFQCNPTTCLVRDVLSLRTIFIIGSEELYKLFRDSESPLLSESSTGKIRGFNNQGIYDSYSYLPICNLISHVSNFRATQILSNIFKCFFYTEILNDKTNFFSKIEYDSNEKYSKEEYKDFISCLLLRHMESIPFNAISISKLKNRQNLWKTIGGESNLEDFGTISYGMGLYALLCLCNHSCDPNVIPLRSPNSTRVSVIALRNIAPGEELCICYGPSFHKQSTVDRREFLQSKYNFLCGCNACTNDWFDIPPENIFKEKCGSEILSKAQKFILEGQFIAALKVLRPCLISLTGKYDDYDPSIFKSTKFCQQLYKLALVWLFNSHCACSNNTFPENPQPA